MTYINVPKNPIEYECILCEYITHNKKDFSKHLLTRKHSQLTKPLQNIVKIPNERYICKCGKEYSHRQSLHTHNKKCNIELS